MPILNFITILNVVVLAVEANETFFCNYLIQNNLTTLPIPGKIHYGISSPFFCASLCSQLESDCTTFDYLSSTQQCSLYADLLPAFLQESDQICQRTNYIPRVIGEIVEEVSNMVNLNISTVVTTSNQTCVPSIQNYARAGSSSCPNFTNCACNQTLNSSQSLFVGNGDDCFTKCANNTSCLAFSFFSPFCYLATQTSHLTLKNAIPAFTCYCQKWPQQQATTSTSVASGGITIGGTKYENLSCYPQQLFSGSSYSPKIPMVNGKSADCKCQGGLYIQNGAYVNQTAQTFVDCFNSCAKIPSPPCKAFAFTERNNTCVIGPTSGNGPSSNTGILTCFT